MKSTVPRRSRIAAVALAALIGIAGPAGGAFAAEPVPAPLWGLQVTNAATGEPIPFIYPLVPLAPGTTLNFYATLLDSSLPGSSGRVRAQLFPGGIELAPPDLSKGWIGFTFTVPEGLDPSITYTIQTGTQPGGTTELVVYTFFSYSFRVQGPTTQGDAVAYAAPEASAPQQGVMPATAPPPTSAPTVLPTDEPSAAALASRSDPVRPPDWPWITLVSLVGVGVLVAVATSIVRRMQRAASYRRLAGRP